MSEHDLYKIPHETSNTRLPEHGSQELVQYITSYNILILISSPNEPDNYSYTILLRPVS